MHIHTKVCEQFQRAHGCLKPEFLVRFLYTEPNVLLKCSKHSKIAELKKGGLEKLVYSQLFNHI